MARHSEILKTFKEMLKSGFRFDDESHKLMVSHWHYIALGKGSVISGLPLGNNKKY